MKPFRDGSHVNGIAFGRSKDGHRGLKTGFAPVGDGFEPLQKGSNDPGKGANASKEGWNDPGKGSKDSGKGWNASEEGSNDSGKGSNDPGKGWNDSRKGWNVSEEGSNDPERVRTTSGRADPPPFGSESTHRPSRRWRLRGRSPTPRLFRRAAPRSPGGRSLARRAGPGSRAHCLGRRR